MDKKKQIVKMAVNKIALLDAGLTNKERYGSGGLVECCSSKNEEKKYYPTLFICDKEAPVLKGSEAGDVKTLVIKVKVNSVSTRDDEKNGKKSDYSLEIQKIGLVGEDK